MWDKVLKALGLRKPRASNPYGTGETMRLFWDWVTSPTKIDEEVRRDIAKLRAQARKEARYNPVAQQYLALLENNVIGPNGFNHQATVRNANGMLRKPVNDMIEEAFAGWGYNCTADGRQSFLQLQHMLIRAVAHDGEQFVRLLRSNSGLRLQVLDPDLLDHNLNEEATKSRGEVRMGVEVDTMGRPVGYWFKPSYELSVAPQRIPATDIIHLYDPLRANQTRGTSWFAPVLIPLSMLDGLYEAILVLNRVAASKMGFFVHKDPMAFDANNYKYMNPLDAAPGKAMALPPGIEFQSWDTGNPSAELNAFSKLILRHIASGWKVSYCALANDLEGVNYSSIRAGMLQERDQFRKLQNWWSDSFLRPVYAEWIKLANLTGELVLPERNAARYQSVRFVGRGWPWVDPLKDIQATILAINNGLDCRIDALAEQGKDADEMFERLAEEQKMAASYGLDFSEDTSKPSAPTSDEDDEPVINAMLFNRVRPKDGL